MKILIDARLYGLENAGLGRYVNNLIAKLSESDKINDYVILLRKKHFDSLDLPSNWKKVLIDFRHYSLKEQLILPFVIKKENPDLVHFPHFNVPIFFRGKFVVTIHDLLMHQQKGMEATTLSVPMYIIKRLGYRLVFDSAIKNSCAIIVPSKSVKNDLVNNYKLLPEKLHVTYEGISDVSEDTPPKIQKPYFVYTGNAYPHKNLKRLIQAFVMLNTNSKEIVTLAIASSRNNFTDRLKKMIKELKAEKYIILLGFVDDGQLFGLLAGATGFVFPSLSEGFGLPGLEAMSAGTVLLASEIPVFKEVYENHAIYFNQLDFTSIESAVKKVLDLDSNQREEIIKSGRLFVKRYSWDKMAEQTLKIYDNTLKKENSNSLR